MNQTHRAFGRWSGASLVLAGALFLLLGLMTPFLDLGALRSDPLFAIRQTIAVMIGIFLLFGAMGVYFRQWPNPRFFATLAFIAACIGAALLVALEWTELFLARDIATNFPDVLEKLEVADGLSPFDWGTMLAAGVFALGWILLSISSMLNGPFSRWPGILIIVGFCAVPALSASLPMPYGPMIGSAIIAAGLGWLGRNVMRPDSP